MPFRKSLYYSFNWRYDSGLVAGSVPCYNAADPNSSCGRRLDHDERPAGHRSERADP